MFSAGIVVVAIFSILGFIIGVAMLACTIITTLEIVKIKDKIIGNKERTRNDTTGR